MKENFREGTPWTEEDMEMRTLSEGPPPAGFDCAAEDQNRFFYERAWRDTCRSISVTHTLYIKGVLAGYVTLMADRIKLGPREKPRGVFYQLVPAIKVAQLAVGKSFAGYGLGTYLVAYAVETAMQMRAIAGCRYITLDAMPHLVGWYEGQGFKRNKEEQVYRAELAERRGQSIDELPISMRFDLRDVREYVEPDPAE